MTRGREAPTFVAMVWIGWLAAVSVAIGLGVVVWQTRMQLEAARKALDDQTRASADTLGEVKASATRQLRQQKAESRHAVQAIATDLVPVADSLDRALAQTTGDVESWREGVRLVRSSFESALARHGVTPVEPEEDAPFAPSEHESIAEEPGGPPDAELRVASVQRRGWRLHERLLRPAEVVVRRAAAQTSGDSPGQKAAPDGGSDAVLSPPVAVDGDALEAAAPEVEWAVETSEAT